MLSFTTLSGGGWFYAVMMWRIVIKFLGSAGRFVCLDDSSWSCTEVGAGCGREAGTSRTEKKNLCSFSHCRCTAMCGRTWLLGPSTAVGSRWSIVKFSTPGTLSSARWASALPLTTMWDQIWLILNASLVDIEPSVLMHILWLTQLPARSYSSLYLLFLLSLLL